MCCLSLELNTILLIPLGPIIPPHPPPRSLLMETMTNYVSYAPVDEYNDATGIRYPFLDKRPMVLKCQPKFYKQVLYIIKVLS